MTRVLHLAQRLAASISIFTALGLSQAASAQCSVDTDAARVIAKLQQSRDHYAVTGTFLKESAGRRDFVSVDRGDGEAASKAEFVNSAASNSEQTLSLPSGRFLDPCEVTELYALSLSRGPKVAGKTTQILQLRPRDTLRLGYVLALDGESGVILRSDTISEKGELLERHEFATVTISAIGPERAIDKSRDNSPRYVKVPGLPDGYRASLARGYEGQALFVSDGIAAATVIFEPLPASVKPGEGAVRRGATLTYTRGSVVSGKNILVTVIGEVPLAAARVIADAVKLTAGQS